MDKDELLKALKEHKKECFHKSSCEICSVEPYGIDHEILQCDYCGDLFDGEDDSDYIFQCTCPKKSKLTLCEHCYDDQQPLYGIKLQGWDRTIKGSYVGHCCPMTKAFK
tara:strand:- start:29787 stop:30113 length:327 start_codon:yes stop_codon:yes gene_type:complete